ncbi:mannose-1-phosphate guanylyltransferase/mannose-6-phosphate isomerase [Chromohalobacter israelensis]|uniref:mannose-1-phosphate guanylyltransferase n=1 Tax=Chromohalobacter israelensis (strain ATCC BAA-138 / DSM 3043 / CIP 106854 / NCIMB 13768 / 1H11) TaxID=290398 RepID=Q1QWW4_CHRI1|nr:mannose-1-phosphate guanylyltransferase/mannose-6-phosphate isomerase [Chromohalobacter salexigens]ABE59044.1 mannose-6-phosphate isomerase, type 2 [Chromohalobacter salexigens DSM 3043]
MIVPVILAGGAGSRLWPLSRSQHPKQFMPLIDNNSMLQETLKRVDGITDADPVLICNEEHRFLAAEQVRQIGKTPSILLEPEGRNTAPAIALAALKELDRKEDPLLLVLAADHYIKKIDAFHLAIESALSLAREGKLVTFGIVPTHAETGYGYIQQGNALGKQGFKVASFVEKPDSSTAESYLASGDFFWNSGMFLFRASRYIEELELHAPDILRACRRAIDEGQQDLDFLRVGSEAFKGCPENSIDYAVMEKTDSAAMVSLDAGWSDIGSWASLWDISDKDANSNVLHGDVLAEATSKTLVQAEHRLVATLGVDDLVIVETKDAVLVAHKNKVQDVKKIATALKQSGRTEQSNHREVYRPWGVYDSVDRGQRYQVKRITVNPGAKLSVQMHYHRAEHWVVVSGTAKVTNGEKSYLVTENESTFIPVGQVHALENPGVVPLELIEIQSGTYLGEDDIVRFDDNYGRA